MVNKGIKIIADFDTYATAYYSACLNTPWTECPEGVYRRPHYYNRRLRYAYHRILLSLLDSPWTECPEGVYRRPHHHYRRLRYVGYGILLSLRQSQWTEWSAKVECIVGHITITAGFDTYATAYYSACLNSPWTEWSALAECIEGHIPITAGFDTYATAHYSACSISPVD